MTNPKSLWRLLLASIVVLSLLLPAAPVVRAQEVTTAAITLQNAKIKVNTLTDEWDTDPATKHKTKCSLREALQATVPGNPQGNQGCGKYPDDTPEFTFDLLPGTYLLTRADQLPNVMKKINIDGKNGVTVDGGGQSAVGRKEGIFIIGSNGELLLSNLTLQHGTRPFGGAIWIKAGKVTVKKVTFLQNLADNGPTTGDGGAIRADTGALTVTESEFRDNTARNVGGAISSGGVPVLVEKSKFIKNHAEGGGGALQSAGGGDSYPTIRESLFRENWVHVVTVPVDWEPAADSHGGGAIQNNGKMVVERTQFYGNYSIRAKGGGAFFNVGNGDALLTDVAMAYNTAKQDPAAVYTFGGAILNEGDLQLVRTSIHHNSAAYGGAMLNRLGGKLIIVNSTVSENQVYEYDGGIANGSPRIGDGGEIYLYHSSVVRNLDNADDPVAIYSQNDYKVWMSNTVIDTTCNRPFNSYGYNIFQGLCPRQAAEQGVDLNSDRSVQERTEIGMEGLDYVGGPKFDSAEFYAMQMASDSMVVDAAGDAGCAQELMANVDQAKRKRGGNGSKCDTGALEIGTSPAKFNSTPAPGSTVTFPPVVLNGATGSSQTAIELTNEGGGVISFQAEIDESWDNSFRIAGPSSGYIFKDQKIPLTLSCNTDKAGNRYGSVLVKSDAKDKSEVRYKLSCATPNGQEAYAGADQKPGPLNAGQPAPGETTQITPKFTNHGGKPLDLELSVKQISGTVWQIIGKGGVPIVAAAATNAGAVRLQPNESFEVEVTCSPSAPGVYVNGITLTTNDPVNPTIGYDLSCEGVEHPQPEKLEGHEFYTEGLNGKRLLSLTLSPDDSQLLASHYDDNGVAVYSRNVDNGSLSLQNTLSAPGMSRIYEVQYSHDGKNVYYTSRDGDGVVTANRDGSGTLTVSQVITKESTIRFCLIGDLPFLCPIGAMAGAEGLAISPDDQNVYVAGNDDATLTVFNRNAATGALSYSQHFTRTLEGLDLLGGAYRVLVSPDGENVYLTSYSDHAVIVFSRQADGRLHFVAAQKDDVGDVTSLAQPSDLAISPDGAFLYVPSHADGALNVFRRSPGDGALELVQTVPNLMGAYAVTVSHDPAGERVLVALLNGNAVQLDARNRLTGELTFVEQYTQLPNQAAMNYPIRLVASADDRDTYVAFYEGRGILRMSGVRHHPGVFHSSPASAPVGGEEFMLTVNGQRFYEDSVILWNGNPLPTTFVNQYQLKTIIPSGNLAVAGPLNVGVRTPTPGGGDSNLVVFAVTEPGELPIPSIESLNPPAALYGSEPLNVVAKGANFTAQSQALLNSEPVSTTFINETTLLIELTADDLAEPGPLGITVLNQTFQAAALDQPLAESASATVKFATAAPGEAALPSISNFVPTSVVAGATGVQLAIYGHNFSGDPDSRTVVLWNGEERETIVIDENKLLLTLADADLAVVGEANMTILTPGVGESNPASLIIRAADANPTPLVNSSYAQLENNQWLLAVNGSDFVAGAEVMLNGANRPTTLVNGKQVTALVSEADLSAGGVVEVVNLQPGGGSSNELVVAPRQNQSIAFGALADQLVTTAPFTVTATASSELPVGISSSTTGVCTITEAVVTLVTVGTCTLVAAQSGDGMFNAASIVERSFQVLAEPAPAPTLLSYLPMVTRD